MGSSIHTNWVIKGLSNWWWVLMPISWWGLGKQKLLQNVKKNALTCQKEPSPTPLLTTACCLDLQFCSHSFIQSVCPLLCKLQSHVSIDDYSHTDPILWTRRRRRIRIRRGGGGGTFLWKQMDTIMHLTHTLWQKSKLIMLILILIPILCHLFIYLFIYFYMAKIINS